MDINSLLEDFRAKNAIKFGTFTLKSGQKSTIYIDLRRLRTAPFIIEKLVKTLAKAIKIAGIKFDYLCGVPYGAAILAGQLSLELKIPQITVRKEAKEYGNQELIETDYESGKTVLLIEDVVTSGSSVIETMEKLRKVGLICEHAFCVVDREQGGKQNLLTRNIQLHSLIQMSTILKTVDINEHGINGNGALFKKRVDRFSANSFNEKLGEIMLNKSTNLCLAIDYNNKQKILEIAEKVKKNICALKLHYDVIKDKDLEFFERLRKIANDYKFMLFEDRKYADTAVTMQMQCAEVAKWADLVTVHANPGKQSITEAFEPIIKSTENQLSGILLVAELSVNGAVNGEMQQVVDIATECGPQLVSGFICQKRCSKDPKFLYWTPGVNSSAIGDGKGQQWRSVEEAIERDGCDLIIVGRGITQAADPASEAKKYQEAGWAALSKRGK